MQKFEREAHLRLFHFFEKDRNEFAKIDVCGCIHVCLVGWSKHVANVIIEVGWRINAFHHLHCGWLEIFYHIGSHAADHLLKLRLFICFELTCKLSRNGSNHVLHG